MDVVSQWFSIRPVAQGWLFPRADTDLEIRSAPFFQLHKEQTVAGVREPMQQANPGIETWLEGWAGQLGLQGDPHGGERSSLSCAGLSWRCAGLSSCRRDWRGWQMTGM